MLSVPNDLFSGRVKIFISSFKTVVSKRVRVESNGPLLFFRPVQTNIFAKCSFSQLTEHTNCIKNNVFLCEQIASAMERFNYGEKFQPPRKMLFFHGTRASGVVEGGVLWKRKAWTTIFHSVWANSPKNDFPMNYSYVMRTSDSLFKFASRIKNMLAHFTFLHAFFPICKFLHVCDYSFYF